MAPSFHPDVYFLTILAFNHCHGTGTLHASSNERSFPAHANDAAIIYNIWLDTAQGA
jgi:hypothetical protein